VATFIRRVRELTAVGRPRRVRIEESIFREVLRLAADVHHVEIAECGEGNPLAVWRDHRTHDAHCLAGSLGIEVALAMRVLLPRRLQRGGELNRLRGAGAVHRTLADLAV